MKVFTPPDDLLSLHTSEDSVVISSLLRRYELSQIYTWLGSNILISLNPNRDIPELYSETKHDSICRNPNLRCSPHIYALAEHCLRFMKETGSHQSIIISGLSGSGKTETAKHTLKYLVRESARKRHRRTGIFDARFENELEHILLQSNPILEAFGNAQTIHNNNSSRFGKFMTLFHNMEQVIIGATVKVYLLEKPRTLFDDSTICSPFHVFRLFLTSLSKEESKAFGLERLVCDFQKNAEHSSSEDQRAWFSVLQSLMSVDYSSADIEQLRNVLASLLLLNTTRFVSASPVEITTTSSKHGSPSGSKENGHFVVDNISATAAIHPDDIEKVLFAARLLGLSDGDQPEQFAHQLITRRIQAGAGSNVFRSRRLTEYSITCNVSQAKEQRDCLVKALYNSLFEHLVHTINERLGSPAGDRRSTELSILDMFGFEQLAQNGFEQYCINYANERLHQNFMRIAVTSIYDDLASEGLASSVKQQSAANILISLQGCDNSSILSAMKTCASLLDEVCLLNRLHDNNTDRTLVSSGCLDQREVNWLRRLHLQRSLSGVVAFSTAKESCLKSAWRISKEKSHQPSENSTPSPKQHSHDSFVIRHFAGPVTYSASGFVTKNLDRLPVHLLEWLAASTSCLTDAPPSHSTGNSTLICSVLRRAANSEASTVREHVSSASIARSPLRPLNSTSASPTFFPTRKQSVFNSPVVRERLPKSPCRRMNTVFENFKSAVDALLARLETNQLFFVRCLRPATSTASRHALCNQSASPADHAGQLATCVDRDHMFSQMASGGLLAAARVLRSTYAARYPYGDFLIHYRVLWHLLPPTTMNASNLTVVHDLLNQFIVSKHEVRSFFADKDTFDDKQSVLLLLIFGLNLSSIFELATASLRLASEPGLSNGKPGVPFLATIKQELLALLGQFGRTRIHLTAPQENRIRRLRRLIQMAAARIIQRTFRRYQRRCHAVCLIQHWWRCCLSTRQSHQLNQLSKDTHIPCSISLIPNRVVIPTPQGIGSETSQIDGEFAISSFPEVATRQPHLISRRSVPTTAASSKWNRHLWNRQRVDQLHCLIPFVWRTSIQREFTMPGSLADALL
ncbi:hypothetical protein PHET_04297 [Paragonimus heterotremus]|uniref:Myosin motor domain-containing protein n=1 Tax=Paragonimus heterotremus TaxID=100268 RepID=A0A8J4TCE0_9TREM|nr:hypothetical protein PHET_04297 [Paragonimus heterotremus]